MMYSVCFPSFLFSFLYSFCHLELVYLSTLIFLSVSTHWCNFNFTYSWETFLSFQKLKNLIKQRESILSEIHWELIQSTIKIRTLRARLAMVFIQLTLEFLSKQVNWLGLGLDCFIRSIMLLLLSKLNSLELCNILF